MTNPRESNDMRTIAAHFGITIDNDVVIDLVQRLLMGPTLATEFITNNFADHEITKKLTKQDVVIFNMAASVRPAGINRRHDLYRAHQNERGRVGRNQSEGNLRQRRTDR